MSQKISASTPELLDANIMQIASTANCEY